jgi:hypothetical protein
MERKPIYQAVVTIDPYFVREFKDFESAKKIDSEIIIRKMFYKTYLTTARREHDLYNYYLLDNKSDKEDEIIFSINDWNIEEIYPGYFGAIQERPETFSYAVRNNYILSDRNGEIREEPFMLPEYALKFLKLISKFLTWSEYDKSKPKLLENII